MLFFGNKTEMVEEANALPGRAEEMDVPATHFVNRNPLKAPFPDGIETVYLALGCFWGAERRFWQMDGVYSTAVGYQGGFTVNPTYDEVCSGKTGHTEAVLVAFDPNKVSLDHLLKTFWEAHDPTQGMRQGNDMGTQYRSAIYTTSADQLKTALASRERYQSALHHSNEGDITTEIAPAGPFYYAETYHQQYLAKNPNGYCGLSGTGVSCPIGLTEAS